MTRIIAAFLLGIALAGCGNGQDAKEISETRTVEAPPSAPDPHAGLAHGKDGAPMDMGMGAMPPGHPPTSGYAWTLPAGWSDAGATPMRVGNFKVDAAPGVECYLTVLTGAAGGAEANVNRWRRQMGQSDLDAAAIAALPTLDMLGKPSPLVEIAGSFTGMNGQQQSGYMLLAVVCALPEETLFVKMTGPEAAVLAEKDRFLEFCKSVKEGGAAADATDQKGE